MGSAGETRCQRGNYAVCGFCASYRLISLHALGSVKIKR